LQSAIVPSGHIFARRAAGAALSLPAYRDEQWNGRTQLRFVQQTADNFQLSRNDLSEKLVQLKSLIFSKDNLIVNLTAEAEGLKLIEENIERLINRLPANERRQKPAAPQLSPVNVGIVVPTQVSYVARVLRAPAYIDPAAAMLMLTAKELSNNYLYKLIRVQGGAYGGMSSYDPSLGLFSFLSYRDPHLAETLKIFQDAEEFFTQNEISQDEMKKAIISTIGMLDKPLDPAGRGYISLIRDFAGLTDTMRQKFREDILSATPQKLRNVLAGYFSAAGKGAAVAVYSSQEKLQEANELLEGKLILEHLSEI
jgi:hypothetical protein